MTNTVNFKHTFFQECKCGQRLKLDVFHFDVAEQEVTKREDAKCTNCWDKTEWGEPFCLTLKNK